jgi:hypothetical protein
MSSSPLLYVPPPPFRPTRDQLNHCAPQSSAEKALELHGRELESGLPLNVYISNPERKKERTDMDANERELYVAGLSKFTTKEDLENLFKTVRMMRPTNSRECWGLIMCRCSMDMSRKSGWLPSTGTAKASPLSSSQTRFVTCLPTLQIFPTSVPYSERPP